MNLLARVNETAARPLDPGRVQARTMSVIFRTRANHNGPERGIAPAVPTINRDVPGADRGLAPAWTPIFLFQARSCLP